MSAIAQKTGAADGGSQQEPLGEGGCLGQLNAFYSFVQANQLRNICDHLIPYISLIHPINTFLSQACFFWSRGEGRNNYKSCHLIEYFTTTHTSKKAKLK